MSGLGPGVKCKEMCEIDIDPTLNAFRMVIQNPDLLQLYFHCCAMRCSWYLCVFTMYGRYEK